jgi:hypothetical protein
MGYKFEVRDANIVAYLTGPASKEPPRSTGEDIERFLASLMNDPNGSLISSDPTWNQRISQIARDALQKNRGRIHEHWHDVLPESTAIRVLSEMRNAFRRFELYVLPIGVPIEGELRAWLFRAAYMSEHHALILIPRQLGEIESLDIFDPTPPIKAIADRSENWPGILFWVKAGTAAFASVQQGEELFMRLSEGFEYGSAALKAVIEDFNSSSSVDQPRRILHLSDLHFGSDDAMRNESYLEEWIDTMRPDLGRIVITGDVFESPRERDFYGFKRFYNALRRASEVDPIIVPGNHDQRDHGLRYGKIGEEFRYLTRMDFSPGVTVDDRLRCIFLRFNSSESGDWARGEISKDQRREVAINVMTEEKRRPEISDYSKIALVHHHPLPYVPEEAQPLPRGLKGLFVGREKFIEMQGSVDFLKWCASRDVPLVLHGHKHLPRHRCEKIYKGGNFLREVTTVGCGTSLGKGGSPMGYNVITWHPEAGRWAARFFSDPGDGSGFEEDFLSLYRGALSI